MPKFQVVNVIYGNNYQENQIDEFRTLYKIIYFTIKNGNYDDDEDDDGVENATNDDKDDSFEDGEEIKIEIDVYENSEENSQTKLETGIKRDFQGKNCSMKIIVS